MIVQVGSLYHICNGTLNGGVAISDLRLRGDRIYDAVIPVDDVACIWFDRIITETDITFLVKRRFGTVEENEKFILTLDSNLPTSGVIKFTTTGPSAFTRNIPMGFVTDFALVQEIGATSFISYHIQGGPPVAP